MTYVSHTVRSLRRNPMPGESVRLVLTLEDDASPTNVEAELDAIGGELVRELPFHRLLAEVAHVELDAICELDGLSAVETDAVIDSSA